MYSFNQLGLRVSEKLSQVCIIVLTVCASPAFAQSKEHAVNIGLTFPVSTHGTHALEYSNVFSLHGVIGLSRAEEGVSIAGLANIVKEDVRGFQLAGFLNTYQGGRGTQLAGFANLGRQSVQGVQLSGFINTAGSIRGLQKAGFMNLTRGMRGVQLAGFINRAGDVQGFQMAGFINVARKVKGAQFAGFINIADSSDYPIGIVNLVKHGEKALGLSIDETQTTLLSFRSGGRVMYGVLGVGYNLKNTDQQYALEVGLGAHVVRANWFRLNAEIANIQLTSFEKGMYSKSVFRLVPAFRVTKHLEIWGGPTLNYVYTNTDEGKSLVKHYAWSRTSDNRLKALYIGCAGGLQWIF